MKLDIQKLESFSLTTQMTVGRAYQRAVALSAKASNTPAELAELAKLNATLAPFDFDATQATRQPTTSPRDAKEARIAADNAGIVLNARKVDQANLSGSLRLELHRQSGALARLMSKPISSLSLQETSQIKRLRNSLRPFVGMEGSSGTDGDFKVVTV